MSNRKEERTPQSFASLNFICCCGRIQSKMFAPIEVRDLKVDFCHLVPRGWTIDEDDNFKCPTCSSGLKVIRGKK
jgi:hypothetical protein